MAGTRKGVPNKRSLDAAEVIRAAFPKWDPLIQLAQMAQDESLPANERRACASEVAQYMHPKRKAVEVTGAGGGPIAWTLAGADARL